MGGRGGPARRGALRADLRRLRRRFGGPARRRARRVRVGLEHPHQDPPAPTAGGLPRAVDALHRVRRADARRRLSLLPLAGARTGVRGGDGRAVRRLRRGAPARARVGRRDVPARGGRAGGRAPAGRERQGARPAARVAAGCLALAHGHLRDRPGVRAADPAPDGRPAAGGARLRPDDPRRDQGDDAELRRARRAAGPRRRVGRLPRAPPRRHRALGRAARARPPRGGAGRRPVGPAAARRRRRGTAAGRLAVRGRRGRRGDDARSRPAS